MNEEGVSVGGELPPKSMAADVVKWLVPSVGALFVVVGYVAQLAHHSFIGFDPGLSEPNAYIATTADFLGWLLDLAQGGWPVWCNALWEGSHPYVVLPALLIFATFHSWRWLKRVRLKKDEKLQRYSPSLPIAALVLLVGLRFLMLDVPVSRLEGVLVPVGRPNQTDPSGPDLGQWIRANAEQTTGVRQLQWTRGQTLWDSLRCSHAQAGPIHPSGPAAKQTAECSKAEVSDAQNALIDGEGLAHVIVSAVVLWFAFVVLSSKPSRLQASVACLGAFSCLALAASFGKLGHPLQYEFARLELDGATSSTGLPALRPTEGLVLQATSDWVTLASEERVGKCEIGIRIWRVSKGEIRWQHHIFRTDILGWSTSKMVRTCETPAGQASPVGG